LNKLSVLWTQQKAQEEEIFKICRFVVSKRGWKSFVATFGDDRKVTRIKAEVQDIRVLNILPVVVELVIKIQIQLHDKIAMQIVILAQQ
jgi:hypothetical protein